MEKILEEEFQSISEIVRKMAPEPPKLVTGLFKAERSLQRLLKPNNVKAVRISADTRQFSMSRPCYIDVIDFLGDDPGAIERKIIVVAEKLDGSRLRATPLKFSYTLPDNTVVTVVRYTIKAMCLSIEVSADVLLRSIYATKVKAYGYSIEQLDEAAVRASTVVMRIDKFDSYVAAKKKDAEAYEAEKLQSETRVSELEAEIESLSEDKGEIEQELESLRNSRNLGEGEHTELRKKLVEAQGVLSGIQNNETQLKQSVESLNREIVLKGDELKSIVNDRSLISDEYKDYVSEGKRQSKVYEWFLYLSMAIIALCAWQLYTGALRILTSDADTFKSLLTLIVQRLPFAAAISIIVGVAWKLASMFVSRIMTIHAQRLALARLLVIAKDTVYSSTVGLDVSDEYKFKERIKLKLMMLRSHLTSELGKDFEYDTTSPAEERVAGVSEIPADDEQAADR